MYAHSWSEFVWVFITACGLGLGWTISCWVAARFLAFGDRRP